MDISEIINLQWAGLFGAASGINLIGYIALVIGLLYERRFANRPQSWLSSLLWAIHGIIFYMTLLMAQLFFNYSPPSVFFTTWSYALRMHAIFAIGGMVALRIIQHRRR